MYLAGLIGELARQVGGALPTGWGCVWREQGTSQLGLWSNVRLQVVDAAHGILGFTIIGQEFQLVGGKHVQAG